MGTPIVYLINHDCLIWSDFLFHALDSVITDKIFEYYCHTWVMHSGLTRLIAHWSGYVYAPIIFFYRLPTFNRHEKEQKDTIDHYLWCSSLWHQIVAFLFSFWRECQLKKIKLNLSKRNLIVCNKYFTSHQNWCYVDVGLLTKW